MAPVQSLKTQRGGLEKIRAHFLTAMHFGKLRPGDRVPSVRRLADLTGMNRKTIHRAYRCLASEGLLELRPGSGTFLTESGGDADRPAARELLTALNRCRADAASLGLEAATFARVVEIYLGNGLGRVRLAVSECNYEQIGLIRRDLVVGHGLTTRPVHLCDLPAAVDRIAATEDGIITTECHRSEVVEVAEPLGIPVYCVALDPALPQLLVHHASAGPLVMVVRDGSYEPVFLKLLRHMSVPEEIIRRFRMVEPAGAQAAFREAGRGSSVYVSPLVEREMAGAVPPDFRRAEVRRHLSISSMDRLRVELALDLAVRERSA